MIVNKYKGNGGGGGGSYVLPVATASRLGGVKVGSGLTIDSGGTLSTEGGSEPVDFNKLSPVSVFPENPMDGEVVAKVKEAGYELVFEQANVPFSAATDILEIECEFGYLHISALQDGDVKVLVIDSGSELWEGYLEDRGEDAGVIGPGGDDEHEWHVDFSNESKTYTVSMYNTNDYNETLDSDNINLNECGAAFNDPYFLADGLYQYDPVDDEWVPVGGEGGEGFKVYEYDEMIPQILGADFPSELDGYLEMGTPVYAAYRPTNNTVLYLSLVRKQSNQRVFEGFFQGYRYTFSVIGEAPDWACSVPTNTYASDYSVVGNSLPSSARTTNGQMVVIPAADRNITVTAYTFSDFYYDESEGGYTFATWGNEDEIHYDNGDFYWVWENDNQMHALPNSNMGYYQCGRDPESDVPYFTLYFTNRNAANNLYIDSDYAENYEFSSGRTTIQIHQYLEEYRRTSDGTYEQVKQRWNLEDEGTFENLGKLTAKGKDYNFFHNGWPVWLEGYDEDNSRYIFHKISGDIGDPNGNACISRGADVYVSEGGIEESVHNYEKFPVTVEYNISTSGLSGGLWCRTTDDYWGGNPIVFKLKEVVNDEEKTVAWTQNVWFRLLWDATEQDWKGDIGERKVFGAQFVYKADTIIAEWAVEQGDGQSQLLSWKVISGITPTYETHDATDSTDPFPSGE